MDVLVNHDGHISDLTLHYTGGLRIPHLVRIPGTFDMLTAIMKPHAKE